MKRLTSLLLAALALSVSGNAAASVAFPETLRQELGLSAIYNPPGCQLCHQNDVGGVMTATKPFGRAMIKVGLTAGSVPSLKSALSTLEANGTDSDGDGSADIDELKAGTNPNVADAAPGEGGAAPVVAPPVEEVPLPETGCSVNFAAPASASATLLGLLALGFLRRRR